MLNSIAPAWAWLFVEGFSVYVLDWAIVGPPRFGGLTLVELCLAHVFQTRFPPCAPQKLLPHVTQRRAFMRGSSGPDPLSSGSADPGGSGAWLLCLITFSLDVPFGKCPYLAVNTAPVNHGGSTRASITGCPGRSPISSERTTEQTRHCTAPTPSTAPPHTPAPAPRRAGFRCGACCRASPPGPRRPG